MTSLYSTDTVATDIVSPGSNRSFIINIDHPSSLYLNCTDTVYNNYCYMENPHQYSEHATYLLTVSSDDSFGCTGKQEYCIMHNMVQVQGGDNQYLRTCVFFVFFSVLDSLFCFEVAVLGPFFDCS